MCSLMAVAMIMVSKILFNLENIHLGEMYGCLQFCQLGYVSLWVWLNFTFCLYGVVGCCTLFLLLMDCLESTSIFYAETKAGILYFSPNSHKPAFHNTPNTPNYLPSPYTKHYPSQFHSFSLYHSQSN